MLRNRYVIGLVSLLLAGVVAWNVNFFLGRRPQGRKDAAAPAGPKAFVQRAGIPQASGEFPVPQDPLVWRRDPFRFRKVPVREGAKAESQRLPALQGILASGDRRFALVDGRVVAVGDRLEGYRIAAIKTYSVLLGSGGGAKEISIINESAKEK
ncbi:MAG: hypothetical protein M0024_14470 [Nitrospiraceae bacterium]|nr:hypothetical protein [Nitrospiraceae bacterium]